MRNRQPADQRAGPALQPDVGAVARSPAERLEPTRPPARPRRQPRGRSGSRGTSRPLLRFLNGLLTFALLLMLLVGGVGLPVRQPDRCAGAARARPRSSSSPRAKARTRLPRGWSARASSPTGACSWPATCGRSLRPGWIVWNFTGRTTLFLIECAYKFIVSGNFSISIAFILLYISIDSSFLISRTVSSTSRYTSPPLTERLINFHSCS